MRHEVLNEEDMAPSPAERRPQDVAKAARLSEEAPGAALRRAPAMSLAEQWRRVRARLQAELGEATFNSWFKQVEMNGVSEGRVMLSVPTRFIRNWIVSHYADRLAKLWADEDPSFCRVDVLVGAEARTEDAAPVSDAAPVETAAAQAPSAIRADTPLATAVPHGFEDAGVGAPLDPRFTFDAFVVGKSNELAHAAARRVAEATDVTFNPLFLYGGVGLGKTHLMHAIAWEIRKRQPERKVLYLSAEKFMYQFVRALRFKDTMAFKQQFRSVDVLMIDDVQFISGKDSTQEEFFHTFNALIDHNRQVIISADRSPSDLEGIEERIRSRLGWGLAADIHPTDYELRLGILQAKADEMMQRNGPVSIPPGVLEFLAHRIVSNVRELEGALKRVVAYASLVGRPITLDMSQEVLRDLLRSNDRKITIEEIQRRVAEYYNVRLADMLSARRARAVARPRQVAMYLSKQLTTRSLPEIGRKFGGRDHTTVIHAVRKIDELCLVDSGIEEDVDLLRRMLEGGHGPN
ncbi:chromosomal replication initiator protein DnaA [Parvibaculum lavamentivorans DS-1]|uniref:Chromosomal replication initiator protein DnaA n=2 Tax=Parvibaculum lavamentivorans TaxID=256618 RepID=A7HNZ3_PARL1|nr:chromosomal replication initiator protein DnaA [Parvibaculum lavamentivorans DS-1]